MITDLLLVEHLLFNDPTHTEIYTLSLHDALPICAGNRPRAGPRSDHRTSHRPASAGRSRPRSGSPRSEEHTSELQSQSNLVCRLLLEKKKSNLTHDFLPISGLTA